MSQHVIWSGLGQLLARYLDGQVDAFRLGMEVQRWSEMGAALDTDVFDEDVTAVVQCMQLAPLVQRQRLEQLLVSWERAGRYRWPVETLA